MRQSPYWGGVADLLTGSRVILAVVAGISLYLGMWGFAAGFVAAAWWTDFFDGLFARSSSRPTKLGGWDLPIDTAVGAALVAGAVAADYLPGWVGGIAVVLVGAFVIGDNPSFGMIVQAIGYGTLLLYAARESRPSFILLILSITIIGIAARRRLLSFVLPTFFGGLRTRRSEREA